MSLNDYARLSNKDLELYKQLSDSSYISINGKRQNSRNFKEGVLNLGQIHFEQPKNVLTKEMILEYQKEQQNKPAYEDIATGEKFNFVPSNVNQALNVFNPTTLPSGTVATENDIVQKTDDLNVVLSNINTLSNDENLIKQTIKDINTILTQLQDSEKEISTELNDLNVKEAQTKNKIKTLSSNINTITKKLATLKKQDAINKAKQDKEDLEEKKRIEEENLKVIQSNIGPLQQKEVDIQAQIATLKTEETKAQRDLRNVVRNKGLEEAKVPNLETELKLLADNYEQNKRDEEETKRQNKLIAKQYEEAFNIANLNRIKIQQEPNESEEDFIKRLQALEQEKFDVNIYQDKAEGEQKKRLSENLKNIIRNDYIIWDVVKGLTTQEVFETNKYFNIISTRLLKIFGYDNKNITAKDLQDEIARSLDIIKTEPENIYEIEEDDPNKPGVSVAETVLPHSDSTLSDFKFKVVDNSLYVENYKTNKGVYLKIGYKDNQKLVFSSDTGLKGSFSRINFKEKTGFSKILKELKLSQDNNKDILLKIFGDNLSKDAIYDRLSSDLTPVDASIISKKRDMSNKIVYGFGLNNKIPETAQFGKNIILLKKLYYNNILSIKDRNLHNIEGIKNIPVSDNFVKIIMDIVTKQKPSLYNINKLKSDEKELYNILLLISGAHKNIKINDSEKTQQINNLKNRLEIAEGEIKAGNDNPIILSELQEIIYKLYHLNAVSLYNARNYLKQFKIPLK